MKQEREHHEDICFRYNIHKNQCNNVDSKLSYGVFVLLQKFSVCDSYLVKIMLGGGAGLGAGSRAGVAQREGSGDGTRRARASLTGELATAHARERTGERKERRREQSGRGRGEREGRACGRARGPLPRGRRRDWCGARGQRARVGGEAVPRAGKRGREVGRAVRPAECTPLSIFFCLFSVQVTYVPIYKWILTHIPYIYIFFYSFLFLYRHLYIYFIFGCPFYTTIFPNEFYTSV